MLMAAYVASGPTDLSFGLTLGMWSLYVALSLLRLPQSDNRGSPSILHAYESDRHRYFVLLIVADFCVGYFTFSVVWP